MSSSFLTLVNAASEAACAEAAVADETAASKASSKYPTTLKKRTTPSPPGSNSDCAESACQLQQSSLPGNAAEVAKLQTKCKSTVTAHATTTEFSPIIPTTVVCEEGETNDFHRPISPHNERYARKERKTNNIQKHSGEQSTKHEKTTKNRTAKPHPNTGGPPQPRNELQDLRMKAVKHIRNAILGLPSEVNHAYLEALRKAPHLVDKESDPLMFLRHSHYNLQEATNRLCSYWKERKALFGAERAFLPLSLTGNDALDMDDVMSLQAGFPALLLSDEQGEIFKGNMEKTVSPPKNKKSVVVYVDPGQLLPVMTSQQFMRGIFYLVNFLLTDFQVEGNGKGSHSAYASPQDDGIEILVSLQPKCLMAMANKTNKKRHGEEEGDKFEKQEMIHRVLDLVVHTMPIQCTWHLLHHNKSKEESDLDEETTLMMQQQEDCMIASCVSRLTMAQQNVHIHNVAFERRRIKRNSPQREEDQLKSCSVPNNNSSSASDHELMRNLLEIQLGLSPDRIPQSLGGSWNFVQCLQWCRKRALKEQKYFELQELKNKEKQNTFERAMRQEQLLSSKSTIVSLSSSESNTPGSLAVNKYRPTTSKEGNKNGLFLFKKKSMIGATKLNDKKLPSRSQMVESSIGKGDQSSDKKIAARNQRSTTTEEKHVPSTGETAAKDSFIASRPKIMVDLTSDANPKPTVSDASFKCISSSKQTPVPNGNTSLASDSTTRQASCNTSFKTGTSTMKKNVRKNASKSTQRLQTRQLPIIRPRPSTITSPCKRPAQELKVPAQPATKRMKPSTEPNPSSFWENILRTINNPAPAMPQNPGAPITSPSDVYSGVSSSRTDERCGFPAGSSVSVSSSHPMNSNKNQNIQQADKIFNGNHEQNLSSILSMLSQQHIQQESRNSHAVVMPRTSINSTEYPENSNYCQSISSDNSYAQSAQEPLSMSAISTMVEQAKRSLAHSSFKSTSERSMKNTSNPSCSEMNCNSVNSNGQSSSLEAILNSLLSQHRQEQPQRSVTTTSNNTWYEDKLRSEANNQHCNSHSSSREQYHRDPPNRFGQGFVESSRSSAQARNGNDATGLDQSIRNESLSNCDQLMQLILNARRICGSQNGNMTTSAGNH